MLFHSLLTTSANSSESPQHRPQHLSQKRRGSSSSSSSGSSSSSSSPICERDSGVENPFAFRTTKPPTSVYILEDTSKKTTTTATTTTSVTYLVKLLTFVLLGFTGGLLYHLALSRGTTPGQQEQLLQANDQIVQQLATENQQHAHELEELKREIAERQTHAGRLRQRQHQAHELTEQVLHAEEMDSHAILWTTDVHDARLDDAHKQAEALLLRARNL